jgi:hypothetical protein
MHEREECSECGEAIAPGAGRFKIGMKRYHVECYDATRHMGLAAPPSSPA